MATKSVGTLAAKLLLDTKGWTGGFASAQKTAKGFATSIGGAVTNAAKSYGAMATAAVAGALSVTSLAKSFTDVDRQAKLADRLGITVGEVQKLSLAADLAGTDIELLAKSMLKMGKNIGSGGMSLDKRLFQVADSIASIKDAGVRGAKAEQIFGKGGLELVNVLIQGGRGIRASADAIDKFGLAISRVDAAKIEAANDAWTEMKTVLGGLRNQIAVELAPSFTGMIRDWLTGLEVLQRNIGRLGELLKDVEKNAESFAKWYDPLLAALGAGPGHGFNDILKGLQEQRKDKAKFDANAGRVGGAGLVAANQLGRLGGNLAPEKRFANPFEQHSVEAATAVLRAGGADGPAETNRNLREMKGILFNIQKNGERAFRKEHNQGAIKPSNLGGGM